MRRVVILGRGGAGKSALARQLSEATGIPAVELDALFWRPGPIPMDPGRWAERQQDLVRRASWILDGDLGPYDEALDIRLRAADTVVVLDFAFLRCAWRTLRRGREQAEYWSWVWSYRRRGLPVIMRAVSACAPGARLEVLRDPAMVRIFLAEVRRQRGNDSAAAGGPPGGGTRGPRSLRGAGGGCARAAHRCRVRPCRPRIPPAGPRPP